MPQTVMLAIALSSLFIPVLPTEAATPTQEENRFVLTKEQISNQRFSMAYPDHWMVTSHNDDFVTIFNQSPLSRGGEAPPYLIKTDAGILTFPLEEALRASEEDAELLTSRRVEAVVVNGRDAVRVWEDGGDTFRNSIATYIPIDNQETAYLISFYNMQNQAAEPAILQLHHSFKLLP